MDQSLKERLVGAAVLVALAVIFVPMVLDGPEQPPVATPTTIAAVPSGASTFRYDLDAPLPQQAAAAPASNAPDPASSAPPVAASPAPVKPTPARPAAAPVSTPAAPAPTPTPTPSKAEPKSATSTTGAWAAQVGSFSKQATADSVAADLKAKGFKAFVVVHKDGKTTYHRVRVGPVATRADADALAKKITAKTGQAARPVAHP